MCAKHIEYHTVHVRLYMYVCMHLQINAALIVPNGSDTVALGRNFEIQIPSALSPLCLSLSLSLSVS